MRRSIVPWVALLLLLQPFGCRSKEPKVPVYLLIPTAKWVRIDDEYVDLSRKENYYPAELSLGRHHVVWASVFGQWGGDFIVDRGEGSLTLMPRWGIADGNDGVRVVAAPTTDASSPPSK